MASPNQEQEQKEEVIGASPKIKKFHNGWTPSLEDLMQDWADKAACARWMHENTSRRFARQDRFFNYPLIILGGLTASGNFAVQSIVGDHKENQLYAQVGLGFASLITTLIQAFMAKFQFSKESEAHRVSALHWGKFNRLLCIEMRLHPDERSDAALFLKMFRTELDRLMEQSPRIPEKVIQQFNNLFKNNTDLVKPDITGILEHTEVYKDTGSRLKRIAAEATIALHYKRGVIKQLVEDEILRKTKESAREEALATTKEFLRQAHASAPISAAAPKQRRMSVADIRKQERADELKGIAEARAGTVAALRTQFRPILPSKNPLPSQIAPTEEDSVPPPPIRIPTRPPTRPPTRASTPKNLVIHTDGGVVQTDQIAIEIPEAPLGVPDSPRMSVDENEKTNT